MHAFSRGFGFHSHAHFCFLSKVVTTRPFFASSTYWVLSPPKRSVTFVFFFVALISCEPTFVFLQPASLPIDHKSQKSQDLIRTLLPTVLSKPWPYLGGPLEGLPLPSSLFVYVLTWSDACGILYSPMHFFVV
jgi:hypothetical protein